MILTGQGPSDSSSSGLGIEYVDITILPAQRFPIRLTFFLTDAGKWEGRDYEVKVLELPAIHSDQACASTEFAGRTGKQYPHGRYSSELHTSAMVFAGVFLETVACQSQAKSCCSAQEQ